MATTAQNLADLFGNDGQCFTDSEGRNLKDAALALGASISYPNGRGTTPIVYLFDDGTAIVECDGGWDFRAEGCEAHCWAGVGCRCGERTEANDADRTEAEALIERSKHHDEIVSVKWTAVLEDALLTRCDDSAENGDVYEFWGEDDGDDWRVHLVKPASEV